MLPISGIMHGLIPRLSEIGYLIVMVSGLLHCLAKHSVLSFAKFVRSLGPYASFDKPKGVTEEGKFFMNRNYIGSAGVDLGVDFNIVSMPDAATISATFSLYKKMSFAPFQDKKWYFSFGLGLPF